METIPEESDGFQASLAALQSENAKLQVSLRNAELEEELLRQDNQELQKQVAKKPARFENFSPDLLYS